MTSLYVFYAVLSKLQLILSNRKISIAIVIISIAARIILQLSFYDIGGDRSYQLVAAKSFIGGHGFSIPQVLPGDLHKQVYLPLIGWPPGYSLFLVPLYFVCGKNIFASAILFEIICAIGFVIVTRRLLQLLNVRLWLLNIYTLLSGFFIYDFAAASSSDFSTLILFLLGIYCILVFIKEDKPPVFGALAGALLFSCLLTRYMYVPVVLPSALYLFYAGYLQRNARLIKGGIYCASVLIITATCLFLYQHYYTGSVTYINSPGKGFYLTNLLKTNPVLFTPFLDIQVFCTTLMSFFKWDYIRQVETIRLIHLIPFGLLIIFCVAFLIRRRCSKKSLVEHYVYLGILSCLAIVFLLFSLSLTTAPELSLYKTYWTYVQEPRYYAFIVLFIHQLVFINLFNAKAKIKSFLFITVVVLFSLQFVHGVYFVTKKFTSEKQNFIAHTKFDESAQYLYFSLDSLKQHYPGKEVIAVSNDITFQNLAALRGYNSLYNGSYLNSLFNTVPGNKVVFLVMLQDEALAQYQNFIRRSGTKFIGKVARYNFFVLET